MRRIVTSSANGTPNGWVLPIWNERYQDWRPSQVYITAIAPGARKGPHLHAKRCGRFVCIRGTVKVRTREADGAYTSRYTSEAVPRLIEVPAGVPAELVNVGDVEALVLNMPTPAWHEDDQDEVPVEGWEAE